MKRKLLAIAVCSVSVVAHSINWNMATPYPEADFHTKNIRQFAQDVATETNGKISITVHSGASLYKAPEIFKAVRSNQVELGELLLASLGNENPLFQLDTLPFLATNYEQAQKLWAVSRAATIQALEKEGVVLLYTTPWPGQNFYSKAAIDSVEYFNGKKMRTYNAMTAAIASHLDASPTTIEVSDIAQAFSTGQIDTMITSSATGVSSQAWDFVNNYTRVNAWLPKNMIFINKRTWQRLDADSKTAIGRAAAAAEKRGWLSSAQINKENEAALADNGIQVSAASEALSAGLAEIGKIMAADWLEKTGTQGQEILDAYQQ